MFRCGTYCIYKRKLNPLASLCLCHQGLQKKIGTWGGNSVKCSWNRGEDKSLDNLRTDTSASSWSFNVFPLAATFSSRQIQSLKLNSEVKSKTSTTFNQIFDTIALPKLNIHKCTDGVALAMWHAMDHIHNKANRMRQKITVIQPLHRLLCG